MKTSGKVFAVVSQFVVLIYAKLIFASTDMTLSGDASLLVAQTNLFGWDLYQTLVKEQPSENVLFSPASIAFVLGMTSVGARNKTADQMAHVMGWDKLASDRVHLSFGEILSVLGANSPGVAIHTANRLCVNNKIDIHDSFKREISLHYKAEVKNHDFAEDAEGSRLKINEWVENQTNKKIRNLQPEGSIDGQTVLLLINAIYFKGDWKSKFEEDLTRHETFFVSLTQRVTVPLMFQKAKFNYGYNSEMDAHAIQLPYVDEKLDLFVVLPENAEGKSSDPQQLLHNLEKRLTMTQLQTLEDVFKMSRKEVRLSLPRFKFESTANMQAHLPALGMTDLFDIGRADLSGLDPKGNVFVSDFLHKAFIDVNEEGSEAAAATAARVQTRSVPQLLEFRADHPFLFFLRDSAAGLILFLGRLVNPLTPSASPNHTEL